MTRSLRRGLALSLAALGTLSTAALAQDAPAPIRDNSFLIEEAYNQERGVVQHIGTFERARGGAWMFSFTQEWPVPDERHQVSFVVPVQRVDEANGSGIGDVMLNYRYQLLAGSPLAISPRVSVLLPTGNERRGHGIGNAGVQMNLPVSVELGRQLVTHFNAGATHVPSARDANGNRADVTGFNLGQSVIWLATATINPMLELLWTRDEAVVDGGTAHATALILAPGVRGAINLPSGMQIVPGIAVPIGIGPSDGERSIFVYLSVEHAFRR